MDSIKTSDQLESIIDGQGLAETLRQLEQICYEKAGHIETNWQDFGLAKVWTVMGGKVAYSAAKVEEIEAKAGIGSRPI